MTKPLHVLSFSTALGLDIYINMSCNGYCTFIYALCRRKRRLKRQLGEVCNAELWPPLVAAGQRGEPNEVVTGTSCSLRDHRTAQTETTGDKTTVSTAPAKLLWVLLIRN